MPYRQIFEPYGNSLNLGMFFGAGTNKFNTEDFLTWANQNNLSKSDIEKVLANQSRFTTDSALTYDAKTDSIGFSGLSENVVNNSSNNSGNIFTNALGALGKPVIGQDNVFSNFAKQSGFGDKYGSISDIMNDSSLSDKAKENILGSYNQFQNSQVTWGDVGKFGLGLATTGWNMYNQHKALKMQKEAFNETRAMNRANYAMQAKAYNNNLRNQQSGRSFNGMSGSAKLALGREYNSRKANETY